MGQDLDIDTGFIHFLDTQLIDVFQPVLDTISQFGVDAGEMGRHFGIVIMFLDSDNLHAGFSGHDTLPLDL